MPITGWERGRRSRAWLARRERRSSSLVLLSALWTCQQSQRDRDGNESPRVLTFLNTSATASPPSEAALGILGTLRNLQRPRPGARRRGRRRKKNRKKKLEKKQKQEQRKRKNEKNNTSLAASFFFPVQPRQASQQAPRRRGAGGERGEKKRLLIPTERRRRRRRSCLSLHPTAAAERKLRPRSAAP